MKKELFRRVATSRGRRHIMNRKTHLAILTFAALAGQLLHADNENYRMSGTFAELQTNSAAAGMKERPDTRHGCPFQPLLRARQRRQLQS